MTQIKLDKVLISSFTEAYRNYATTTASLSISGAVADGGTANFSAALIVGRSDTLADIYAENRNTGKKMSLIAGSIHHPYQAISTETHAHAIDFSGLTLTVTLSIDNFTGGLINLTSQVWTITAVFYEVPYTA